MPPIPGFLVVMGTNGVLLNDEVVEKMQGHGVTGAGISLDSIQPTNHDRFRGMEGAWKATMNGCRGTQTRTTRFPRSDLRDAVELR